MQDKVFKFVQNQIESKKMVGDTLDVGSYDVNGSVKALFSSYTGLDMREGANVDIVGNSHRLPFKANSFDIVTCLEMLEHDDNPFKTLEEIYRVLKKGGWAIVCASGISFPKHDYPSDYFRYTAEGLGVLMKRFKNIETVDDTDEVYGVGQKILKK